MTPFRSRSWPQPLSVCPTFQSGGSKRRPSGCGCKVGRVVRTIANQSPDPPERFSRTDEAWWHRGTYGLASNDSIRLSRSDRRHDSFNLSRSERRLCAPMFRFSLPIDGPFRMTHSSHPRIGILTSGGDCPGLNAVIRGTYKAARQLGYQVIGFQRGYEGLVDPVSYVHLDDHSTAGILVQAAQFWARPIKDASRPFRARIRVSTWILD